MPDYHNRAKQAKCENRHQPGLIKIVIKGDLAFEHRYQFDQEASASMFMVLRGVLRQHDRGVGDLRVYGRNVVNVWG